jgi:hypothetical protein
MRIWQCISLSLIFSASAACQAMPLSIQQGPLGSGKMFLPCEFDGTQDLCFLDTGSTNSFVANKSNFSSYPKTGTIRYKSASGIPKEIDEIEIGKLQLGQLSLSNFKIGRIEDDPNFTSVVGINAFALTQFGFIFSGKPELTLNQRPNIPLKSDLSVLDKNILTVPIIMNGTKSYGFFDTGAGLSSIDIEFVKKHPENFEFVQDIPNGTDATGKPVVLKLFKMKNVVVGSIKFENENVLAMDFSVVRDHVSKEADFIIGFNLITKANWYFDIKNHSWNSYQSGNF